MNCRSCGNKTGFLVMVTDYKPLELWEYAGGTFTRYYQKDSGDIETSIQCATCGSDDVDTEGQDTENYSDRPLVILSEGEWEEKTAEFKKEEKEDKEETETKE
jgi:hypothetical protein